MTVRHLYRVEYQLSIKRLTRITRQLCVSQAVTKIRKLSLTKRSLERLHNFSIIELSYLTHLLRNNVLIDA